MHKAYSVVGVILLSALEASPSAMGAPGSASAVAANAPAPTAVSVEKPAGVVIDIDGTWYTYKTTPDHNHRLKIGSQLLEGHAVTPDQSNDRAHVTIALLDGNHFEAECAKGATKKKNCEVPICAPGDDGFGTRIVTAMIRYFSQDQGSAVILTLPRSMDKSYGMQEAIAEITPDGVQFSDLVPFAVNDTIPCTLRLLGASKDEDGIKGSLKFTGTGALLTGTTLAPGLYKIVLGEKETGDQSWVLVEDPKSFDKDSVTFAGMKKYARDHWSDMSDQQKRDMMRTCLYSLAGGGATQK